MCPSGTAAPPASADKSKKARIIVVFLLCLVWLIAEIAMVVSEKGGHYTWFQILPPLELCIFWFFLLLDVKTVFGNLVCRVVGQFELPHYRVPILIDRGAAWALYCAYSVT